WAAEGSCGGAVTVFLSAVSFAKSKSKNILVRMVSQAGTGFSFNTKRSRLGEKRTLLHYDPFVRAKVLFVEQEKIRSI
ncbi:39S ribosomal protein L33, mitochondrial-like, partial [Eptesicus fuscus]|uniref:39S ribosomal protein L33, mitochondrial-like n=1 Tax=Eptesicus fuscus TaxID=29078 RepID=UPI0024048CB1